MNKEETALVLLVAVEGAHAYSAFLPSIFTIREFHNENTVTDIRIGESLATLFVVLLGIITSAIVDNNVPFWIAATTAIAMISVYEWALRTPRSGSGRMNKNDTETSQ